MKYILSYANPHHQSRYIGIEFVIENNNVGNLLVQLPSWRPGRYELGNFAKNIQRLEVLDSKGNPLKFQKIKKDLWEIKTDGAAEIHINYNYYAAELNAGSTWLSEEQLYVNPVNCLLFVPARINEECIVELRIPEDYLFASSLISPSLRGGQGVCQFRAKDFHELADSPFIASNSLQHHSFICENTTINLWFQGLAHKPDWSRLENDFFKFIKEQYLVFGSFPFSEYHFLIHLTPHQSYHGVEHQQSTVITLGPAHSVFEGDLYNELLGVSSHEIFHAWNIKKIRPIEMFPYDYTKENYSRLGFVCEGITTYYGDLMLFRAGVFSEEKYFIEFNKQLQKHFDNFGRWNMSVADSSFDTWLDGYSAGVPNRKTSIYTEGCLLAFMTDVLIRKHTNNKKSLDDVMRALYNDFGQKERGYSEKDYQTIVETVAGISFQEFFNDYVYGTKSYEPILTECLEYLHWEIKKVPSPKYNEAYLGFKVSEEHNKIVVKSIYPNSAADKAGLKINDEIVAVNGTKINTELHQWCNYASKDNPKRVEFAVVSAGKLKSIVIEIRDEIYYQNYFVVKKN